MQEKKVKIGIKRNLDNIVAENQEKHKNPKKKSKTINEEDTLPQPKATNGTAENSVKKLDTSIFQNFTDLTQEDEGVRLQAALKLIQTLQRTKEPEKHQKELSYALKRLIRGCGAATNSSRSGFFTGLVAFLKTFKSEEIEIGTIFDTMQKELHVGTTLANKEDADAVVGKILVCGALLRSGRIHQLNSEHLERITNILLQATRQKSYHTSFSYAFLIEIFETALTEQQFEDSVWPLLHKELTKPWSKQTLQTVHCLMVAQQKFPTIVNAKYFKTHFGGRELLNNESYEHMQRIFWSHSDMQIVTHPAFEVLGIYLANCQNLVEFWTKTVDAGIETPTKLSEYLTLKIATDIIQNLKAELAGNILIKLLSSNFMKMLLNGLKQIKIKKDDTLKAFYDEFMEALVNCCAKLPETADSQKVAIIRRLILYPGTFCIEKYTSTRVIHQLINSLGFNGVQEIFLIYKQIFCGMLQKQTDEQNKEEWQNFERANAGYMLQHLLAHKAVQHNKTSYEWRTKQLRFLLICGVFHVQQRETNSAKNSKHEDIWFEPCKKDVASSFSKEFGEQCKNMFYTSLQSKFSDLQQERALNLFLVEACDKYIEKDNHNRFMRIKLGEQNESLMSKAWQKMKSAVNSSAEEVGKKFKKLKPKTKEENDDKLQSVFHIMLLNMGLQLFKEPDMAAPAIEDLIKCMQRIKKQPKPHNRNVTVENGSAEDNEPDWIEVVIDLFLHLLSQNTGALRSSVNNLFPHLCNNLNVSAIHQILAVLDMKDGQNPLSRKDDDDDDKIDDDEEEISDDNASEKSNEENEESDDTDTDEDLDDDDDDEEEEDDEDIEEDDADITATDKLRNAISQALIANGAVLNGAENNDNDDMASVDLNDMTEEEGRRLDEALAAAFKTMKKSSNTQGNERKKTKSQRIETTAVMHFRIRVLDLIDIYIQQSEVNLMNHIEIMLALYNMLEYCWSEELKPLQTKVEKVLQKLTASKSGTTKQSTVDVEGLRAEDLVNYIRQLAEKKAPSVTFDITNSIRNRCIVFLINNASKLVNGNDQVLEICIEYQQEFLNSRNPTVNITLLSEIYKLQWPCIWNLCLELAQNGLQMSTRAFRRIQVCEILTVLYRNNALQKNDEKTTQKTMRKLEDILITYVEELTTLWITPQVRQSHKEFHTLLEMILQAQRTHSRLKTPNAIICSAKSCEKVQNLRRHIRLESTQIYQKYCAAFKLSIIRNNEVVEASSATNENAENSDNEMAETEPSRTTNQKKQHNKVDNADKRKHRKQKKIDRMLAASKGINGGFGVKRKANHDSGEEENE